MSRPQTTRKFEIIKMASEFFFDIGYSNTSPKMIAKKMNVSPGNITHYFPTKEHLLCVIVEMLCDFQWKMLQDETKKGYNSVSSICIEMMTVATACEESKIARDFFTAVYESEMCRNYLRKNHVERAKVIFEKECKGWNDEQFEQAEILVMGLQYATIAKNDSAILFKNEITEVLDKSLEIYQVDKEIRKQEIEDVMKMDCRGVSKQVLKAFIQYVEKCNEEALENMREIVYKREE